MISKYDLVKSYYINDSNPLGKYFSWVHLFFVLFLIVQYIGHSTCKVPNI